MKSTTYVLSTPSTVPSPARLTIPYLAKESIVSEGRLLPSWDFCTTNGVKAYADAL